MSNSTLISYTKLSPNHSGKRTHAIDRITPHCVVGQCTVQSLGETFAQASRQASSNYGIGKDGKIALYVDEGNRSWCSSSNANDQRAVTIECASDATPPYAFNDAVYQSLINLCADICKRNNKKKLLWLGDKNKTLNYAPKADEMVLTVHRWFANKSCPGDWMYARMGDLAEKVNAKLGGAAKPSTPKPSKPTDNPALLDIDGSLGPLTIKAWQRIFSGDVADGVVSNQPITNMTYAPKANCPRASWEFVGVDKALKTQGSSVVRATQKVIGAQIDGYAGTEFWNKLSIYLRDKGYHTSSYTSCNETLACAFQHYLNACIMAGYKAV